MKRSFKVTSVLIVLLAALTALPLAAWATLHADYDGDGKVGSRDALYLLHHLEDPENYPINQRGDVTGNGESTEADVLYLLRHSLDPERYPLATEHEEEIIPAKEPTCTEDGLTEGIRCSVCGDILKEQEVVPAAHTFSRWFEVEAGGCSLEPYHVRFCTVCGYFETDLGSDVLHAHEWVIENKDATCTEDGYRNYLHCVNCDVVVNKDVIPAPGKHSYDDDWTATETYHYQTCNRPGCGQVVSSSHDYSDYVIDSDKTCTEDGSRHKVCTVCEYTKTEAIPASHEIEKVAGKSETCTEAGYKAYEYCTECSYTTFVEIPALGHDVKSGNYKKNEEEHWLYCTRCTHTEGHVAHSFGEWVTIREMSCQWDKIEERKCSVCEYKETKTTKSEGHVAGDWYSTSSGHYQDCIYCNLNMYLGAHIYTNWTVETPATCTEKGTEIASCDVCGYENSRQIDVLGHDYTDAPWSSDETSHWYSCQRPGCFEQSDKKDHSFGDFVTDVSAGCESAGSKHKSCSVCEYRVDETIDPLGHSYEGAKWENNATHHWKSCIRNDCDVIDAESFAEHDFSDWTVTKDPTCTEDGTKERKCDCGYVEAAAVPEAGHNMSELYSISAEEHWKRCLTDGCDYIEELGKHEFGKWEEYTAPTCTKEGTERRYCAVCTHYESRSVDELGHVASEWISTDTQHYKYCSRCELNYDTEGHEWGDIAEVKATCETGGYKSKTCTVCEYTKKYDEGESLGHLWANAFTDTEHYEKCQREGCGIRRNVEAHTMGQWEKVKEPTCTAEGAEERKCDGCDHKETKSIPVVPHDYGDFEKVDDERHARSCKCGDKQYEGHSMVYVKTVDVTCESDGYKYYACNFCEHTEKRDVITAPGHSLSDWQKTDGNHYRVCNNPGCDTIFDRGVHSYGENIIDLEATCEKEGEYHKECVICHYETKPQAIPATGHDHSADWSYDQVYHYRICANDGCEEILDRATHNTNGFGSNEVDHWYNCTVCPKVGLNIESHTYGEWKTVTAATCTSEGLQKRYCTLAKCGHEDSETKTLPMLDHDLYEDVFTEQIHEDGVTYNHHIYAELCKNCDYRKDLYDGWVHIHDSVVFIPETPATCTTPGLSAGYKCAVDGCLEDSRVEIPALGHDYVDGVCTRCGDICPYTWGLIFTLSYDGTYYSVTGIDSRCTDTDIIIPDTYKGKPVKAIGDSAFKGNTQITSVDIPRSVTIINKNAFYICSNLVKVELTDGLKKISDSAFMRTGVESITIPDTVTWIGADAFKSCENLTTVNIGSGLTRINSGVFYYCDNITKVNIKDLSNWCAVKIDDQYATPMLSGADLYVNGVHVLNVIIPNDVTTIERYTFYNCRIESLVVPDTVTTIGSAAFAECIKLSKVSLGNGLETISASAFRSSGIVSLTVPDSVKTIGDNAFANCHKLTTVILGNSIETISYGAFADTGMESIIIPDSVNTLGENAFFACDSLTNVVIGKNITVIPQRAFYGSGVTNLIISDSVTTIETESFYGCPLASVTWGNGLLTISDYAFQACAFESLNIPDSVTTIGDQAFAYCKKLETVAMGANIRTISNSAFVSCKNLKLVKIGSNVQTIGIGSFAYCTNLESIVIPDTVTTIGINAFVSCDSLYKIFYVGSPEQWVNISVDSYNDILTSTSPYYYSATQPEYNADYDYWHYVDGVPTIWEEVKQEPSLEYTLSDDGTYYIVTGIGTLSEETDIVIPDTHKGLPVKEIGDSAFKGNTQITFVEIPDSVVTIGELAFYSCSELSTVKIGNGLTSISNHAFDRCSKIEKVVINDLKKWCSVQLDHVTANPMRYGANIYENETLITTLIIPNGTKSIQQLTFCYSNIESVIIPDSVTVIGEGPFANCINLKTVLLGNGITSIPESAFLYCESLESIVISENIHTIEWAAFNNCSSLNTVYYLGAPNKWNQISIGDRNDIIKSITPYYYSETQPEYSEDYDYWHYVDGVPTVWEEAEPEPSLEYTLSDDGTYYIVTGIGTLSEETDIIIPDTYNGKPVKEIGAYAFDYKLQITSVEIPDSVTKIANDAFCSCNNLTTLKLGTGVTEIGIRAFYFCDSLNKVYIKDLSKWCSIQFAYITANPLYYGADLYVNETLVKDLVIPSGVTAIKQYAFACSNIKSVVIPDSVKVIEKSAFESCENLTTVTLGKGITSIEGYAFYYSGIESVVIPDSVTSLGDWVFGHCYNLKTVKLGNGLETISSSVFSNCTGLKSVIIGANINSAEDYAFSSCNSLSEVYFCGDFEQWEYFDWGYGNDSAEYANHYFYSETQPTYSEAYDYWHYVNGVPTVWEEAKPVSIGLDYELSSDRKYYTVTGIGSCTDTDIVIPDTYNGKPVKEIGFMAFYNLANIESVSIPDSVTTIGQYAFFLCQNLEKIELGNGIVEIQECAFLQCIALDYIIIPESVTKIGDSIITEVEQPDLVIYYAGTSEQWKNVEIGSGNVSRVETPYYYSATRPSSNAGSYWRYVNGVPTVWA